jgi:hypothetical protein
MQFSRAGRDDELLVGALQRRASCAGSPARHLVPDGSGLGAAVTALLETVPPSFAGTLSAHGHVLLVSVTEPASSGGLGLDLLKQPHHCGNARRMVPGTSDASLTPI